MNNLIIVLIFLLCLLFRVYIYLFVPLRPYIAESILFLDLLNMPILLTSWAGIFFGLINLALLTFISKKIINSNIWFILPLIYAISPWSSYLEVGGSLYIPIVTCLLLTFIILKFIKVTKLNILLLIFTVSMMIYISLLMWFVVPILIFSLLKLGFINLKDLKNYLLIFFIFCLPLFFISFTNMPGLKNIFSNQVSIFAEVGLINTVNSFRGETAQTKLAPLGKFIENRYLYLSQHFIFNLLKHIVPVTYFTPEFKLFDFSFNPPIQVGFLVPFLFGLKRYSDLFIKNKWVLLTFIALISPSVLSKSSPDLNRLILIAPAVFILIEVGFKDLLSRKAFVYKFLLLVIFVLVFTQTLTILSDTYFREAIRLYQIRS